MSTKLSAVVGLLVAASVASGGQPENPAAGDPLATGPTPGRTMLPLEGMNEEVGLAGEPRDRTPPAAARAYHPRYYEPEFMVVPRFRRPWHHQQHRDAGGHDDR